MGTLECGSLVVGIGDGSIRRGPFFRRRKTEILQRVERAVPVGNKVRMMPFRNSRASIGVLPEIEDLLRTHEIGCYLKLTDREVSTD
jgi:hypothetical protein